MISKQHSTCSGQFEKVFVFLMKKVLSYSLSDFEPLTFRTSLDNVRHYCQTCFLLVWDVLVEFFFAFLKKLDPLDLLEVEGKTF